MIVQPRLSIDVPPQLLTALGWDPASPVVLSVEGGALVVRPLTAPSPSPMMGDVVLSSRMALAVTRSELAWLLGVMPSAVAAWEEGRAAPDGAARERLSALEADPDTARARLAERD